MSLIGKEISDFTVQAFTGNEFKEVKKVGHIRKVVRVLFLSG